LLRKFDKELGKIIWEDRKIELSKNATLWDEIVAVTYASYCLASRLLVFNDKVRAVPKGSVQVYKKNFDKEPMEITNDNWKSVVDGFGLEKIPKKDKVCQQIYNFALAQGGNDVAFNYLSLLILVDAVDCVAKTWGKIVEDHLDISCDQK
jgi:hypothetical protein